MEPTLKSLEEKINAIYTSVEKTRNYIKWAFIISVLAVVLPMIGLLFAIPSFLSNFSQLQSLGL
jgi:uncharacterized BrkB/YihY/UPF0761 family membrane protein